MKKIFVFVFTLLIASSSVGANSLPKFTIMTEDWVPYQFKEGSELRGIAVDLMVEMLERTGSTETRKDIQMLPWARAYRNLQVKENTVLFSMTRSSERENLFRWVGPIFQNTTYLIAAKKKNIRISSSDDLRNYRFGTIYDDASEMFLSRHGVSKSQFLRNSSAKSNLRMLERDRMDMIVSGWEGFISDATETGIDPSDFERVYTIDVSEISVAFHRNTPDWIIQRFQKVLDDIKAEGLYDRIFEKYKAFSRDE